MRKLLRSLSDFFYSIFSGNSDEVKKRRELRLLEDQLQTLKPHVYKAGTSQVTESLADAFYEFYQDLAPIGEVLNKTIDHSDQKLAQKFKELIIDSALSDQMLSKRFGFDYEQMLEAVNSAENPEKELEAQRESFNSFIEVYSTPDLRQRNMDLGILSLFSHLYRHDWQGFFAAFDPKINLDNKNYKPKFSPVSAESILGHLLDFYYLLASLIIDQRTESILNVLNSKLTALNVNVPDMKLKKALPKMLRLTRKHLSAEYLLTLIRIIKADPVFKPKYDKDKTDYVANYKANLTKQFQINRERIGRERHESSLKSELDGLFGTVQLMKIKEYHDDINKLLTSENLEAFKHIQGMRVLKTFAHVLYEKEIRMGIKKILIDGFFENKSFQNMFSNHYYKTENTIQNISDFENSLTEPGKHSMGNLRKFIEQHARGKNMLLLINKFVSDIDERAVYILENEVNTYYQLTNLLREVLEDYKRRVPEFVSNIKVLDGQRNREYIGSLAESYKLLVRFLRIMKNFTIIKTQPKERQA